MVVVIMVMMMVMKMVMMMMMMVMMVMMMVVMVVIKRAGGVFFPQVETFPPDIWWKETQEKYTDPGTYLLFAFEEGKIKIKKKGKSIFFIWRTETNTSGKETTASYDWGVSSTILAVHINI